MNAARTPGPWELIEANEHHGPFIIGETGDVCDLYVMTRPGFASTRNGGPSKPHHFANAEANAAFIVRAVNCHDELLAALKALHHEAGHLCKQLAARGLPGVPGDTVDRVMEQARAAIAKAEGDAS